VDAAAVGVWKYEEDSLSGKFQPGLELAIVRRWWFISIPTKFLSRLVQACTSKKSPKKPESHKLDQLGHIFSQAYSGNSENLVFKN
jgi:hypothetical protein